ncbi:hypothetical protein EV424DRAFT_1541026 [Suillus variegatus]|nr:hypothetical protein EV424DRAFT_1541026 [Suillus variegatus]
MSIYAMSLLHPSPVHWRRVFGTSEDKEFVAPKEFPAIIKELEDATGIDARALICFRPGMNNARQRLQWESSRITKLQEDIAYSLFGIFGFRYLQYTARRSGTRSGGSCRRLWLARATSLSSTGSDNLPSPIAVFRLHLPCTAFRVTEVTLSYNPSQETRCEVKADVLRDL